MKGFYLSIMLMLATVLSTFAYNVEGLVVDNEGEPLIRATVRVLNMKDSTAVKGAITDDYGHFAITEVKKGKYLLEATYVGCLPNVQEINLNKNLDMGKIVLQENAEELKDITVVGIKTPIKVMEDTVEFNADSYKTQPNAVVEDLLKRLPGVEVDSDGKITHNGKEIKKILVDGKEFFADDPTVASRNVPVDLVDKLQVVDRKSDLARMTGVDDGEEETVINLTVKKGMNNGWFGNAEAGYGTDSRYKGNFNINRFWNGNQFTILGNANNVNQMGFGDGGAGRFNRFGGGNGITTTRSVGVNFNVGNEEIFRVGGDVMYSHSKRDNRSRQNRQYLFADSTSFYDSNRNTIDRGNNLRADFRMQWKPDSFNTLEFRPNASFNFNDSERDELSNTFSGYRGGSTQVGPQVNRNASEQMSHGSSYEFGGRIIYNHNVKSHRGRSMSFFANLRTSNVREYSNTFSDIIFHMLDSTSVYDQFDDNHRWTNNFSTRVSWTEPLGDVKKGNFLTLSYQFSYRWNNSDKLTYDRPIDLPRDLLFLLDPLPQYDVFVDSLSNQFRNNYMNQDIRLGYRHVTATQNLDVGFSLVPQMSKSTDLINDAKSIPERWVWNYAPYLRYRYKMSKTRSMNIDYRGNSSQPSMTQLQPVADMSDPLNVVQGNPNLDPSFNHNLQFRFQDFNMESQRAMMLMVRGSMSQNAIVQRSITDPTTGGRWTTYENVNGIWDINAFSMFSFPFRNKSWSINNSLGGGYNHNVGFVQGEKNLSGNLNIFETVGIAYRPDNLEIELRPTYRLQVSTNSVQKNNNRTVHNFGGRVSGTYYTKFGLVLNTDLNFNANKGYGAGYNTNEWMWNASISYQCLRNRELTISLSGYDLLQQRKAVNRSVNAQYIQDSISNTLQRYFMLSVSYKFNSFGGGGRRDGGPDGPMGPGGPGGPGGWGGPGRGGMGGRPPMR